MPGQNVDKPDGHRSSFRDRAFSSKRRKQAEKHIVMEENALDLATCTHLVTQYLLSQGWRLTDPRQLAAAIYQDLAGENLAGKTAVEAVQTQTWQRYAAILHDGCRQPDEEKSARAWTELGHWLGQQAHRVPVRPEDREDMVQEALADLQTHLAKSKLNAPRAYLMYALQTLRRKAIDLNRKRTAVSRGGERDPLSWEAMNEASTEQNAGVTSVGFYERRVENAVSDAEVRIKLKAFFQRHLPSQQQQLVAELYFLDGLELKEIAGLLGKRPHPIRMVKARIVQTLRALPVEQQQELLAILDELGREEGHAS